MSLSASEVRALSRIEQALLSRDPRLRSLFSIFTRLTWQEAMPAREQIRRRGWRPQPGVVVLIAIVLTVGMIIVSSLTESARPCGPSRTGITIARAVGHGCVAGSASPPTTR